MVGNRRLRCTSRIGASLAVSILVLQPQWLLAESASNIERVEAARVLDIALQPGGVLQGRIVGAQGQPVPETQVSVSSDQQQWVAATDAQGRFAVRGLPGNTYQIRVGNHSQLVRAWAPGTAPPQAISEIMLVPDSTAVLGQHCGSPVCGSGVCGGGRSCLRNPLILGGIIAAAIAIPIAIENSDDDPAST